MAHLQGLFGQMRKGDPEAAFPGGRPAICAVKRLLHKIRQIIQPERDCASWQVSIVSARQAILEGIEASPSLRPYLKQNLQKIHQNAMELALIETGLEHAAVPKECPWDFDTLLTR